MKTLAEMTTDELKSLLNDVDANILIIERAGMMNRDLANFRRAIDNELDRRGA